MWASQDTKTIFYPICSRDGMGSRCNERRASLSRGAQMPNRASTSTLRQASRCLGRARRRTWAPGNASDIFTRHSFSLGWHHQNVCAPWRHSEHPSWNGYHHDATCPIRPHLKKGDGQELLFRSNTEYKPAAGVTRPSTALISNFILILTLA